MVSFTQIAAVATAFASMSNALAVQRDSSVVKDRNAVTGTACCVGGTGCNSVSGTAPTGQTWEYCWYSGNEKFTAAEKDMTTCLTGLHTSQNSACISGEGSPCANGNSLLQAAQNTMLWGNHQLSEDDRLAIVDAAIAASENGDFSYSLNPDAGDHLTFTHTAENGSGINGIEMYGNDFKC
ncbi:hypothetical protein V499_03522 [Pseudogymnoascus sp. VKM F-103]|nr:hypothetical protein V499_03522 [Pseudogymnoascus sp. VKM F-103]